MPHKTTTTTTIADVFKFPDAHVSVTKNIKQHEYKSNVQIIPSSSNNSSTSSSNNHNNSSTIQVLGNSTTMMSGNGGGGNQYTTPGKKSATTIDEHSKITTVHVAGTDNTYGTCFTPPPITTSSSATTSHTSTPKMPKKIILSANTSGVTNITVNNTKTNSDELTVAVLRKNSNAGKLDQEFLISNNVTASSSSNVNKKTNALHYEKVFLSSSPSLNTTEANIVFQPTTSSSQNITPMSPKWSSPHHRPTKPRTKEDITGSPLGKSSAASNGVDKKTKAHNEEQRHKSPPTHEQPISSVNIGGSPAMARRRFVSPTNSRPIQQSPATRPPFLLTRGLTEAVITSRPSRRDFHFLNKLSVTKTKSSNPNANSKTSNTCNNNENGPGSSASVTQPQLPATAHLAINRTATEALEQRRRSSSTSDAQAQRHARGTNNNDPANRINVGSSGVGGPLRQPPQPFRLTENILGVSSSPGGNVPPHNTNSPAKRMTLREQQVMQLRREIMHPGGVRLQLRRKDCVGSIAWVDAFGAVW